MKKKKQITKTQYIENNAKVLNFAARLIVCAFLLGVIIYSLPL
jgi:hypothetical protein